jgi:diaminopimelate epimerase
MSRLPERPSGASINFAKMHGLGNDYVYVDGSQHPVADAPALARWVSDRHVGVGSDGLIMVEPVSPGVDADVRMRMFNADGSEGMMCGNGIRCVAKFAVDRGISASQPLRVETRRGVLSVHWRRGGHDGTVSEATVDMGSPILALARVPAAIPGVSPASAVTDFALPDGFWKQSGAAEGWEAACGLDPRMTLVSMGNPHAVLWCTDVARVPLDVVGPFAERHPWFPERMNVHFVQVLGPGEVRMRTWERGSGATQACGTGASAVCVAGVLTGRTQSPLLAHLPGGDLVLEWSGAEASVRMTGPAVEVFQGALDLGAQPVGQAR